MEFLYFRVPLCFAVWRNDVNLLQTLLDFKADPNSIVKKQSLLSIAAKNGCAESIELLLNYGASMNTPSESHPLESVLKSGSKLYLSILLNHKKRWMFRCCSGDRNEELIASVIAFLAKKEVDKQIENKEETQDFPPKGCSSK